MAETSCNFANIPWLENRFNQALSPLNTSAHRRGRKATVGLVSIFVSLVRQKLFQRGALDEHLLKSCGEGLQGSTISRRLRVVDLERLNSISDYFYRRYCCTNSYKIC